MLCLIADLGVARISEKRGQIVVRMKIFNWKPYPPIKSRAEQVIPRDPARSLECYCHKKSLILVGQVKTTKHQHKEIMQFIIYKSTHVNEL